MALMKAVSGVFIVGAKRTAFGAFGGKLKNLSGTELGVLASQAALESANVNPEDVSSVIFGNVVASEENSLYSPRHISLMCGIPEAVSAYGINRLCGSGIQSVISGAQEIMLGFSDVVLVGGVEQMSKAAYAVRGIRFGTKLGVKIELADMLFENLYDAYAKIPIGLTGENLAEKYNISREECDAYAFQTQSRWQEANAKGIFKDEIVPVTLQGRKGSEIFEVDEPPRMTPLDKLAKLRPVFKEGGVVTAANASGLADGACSLVLASEAAVKRLNLKPLAQLASFGISGCDPFTMGIGPAPASRAALKAIGKEVKDMDVVEVNEAFASQFLSVSKELGLDNDKTNINGGALAMGHPLAVSGARIIANLAYEIKRRNLTHAMGSACLGGGQGVTAILEKV